jgi:periplasmic divalent cation tolerance protein
MDELPFVQVMTTTDTRELAERLGRLLVEKLLAGCVQIAGPIRSIYRWQGAIEQAEEWLCLIKTRRELLPQVLALIQQEHSYQVPEILALPVLGGNPAYLQWLEEVTQAPPRS